jgi:hypothetical protein
VQGSLSNDGFFLLYVILRPEGLVVPVVAEEVNTVTEVGSSLADFVGGICEIIATAHSKENLPFSLALENLRQFHSESWMASRNGGRSWNPS